MKFIINKERLIDHLQKVIGPTTTKQNTPILNSVLLTVSEKKITLTSTDIDITIITSTNADVISSGQVVIPMKKFFLIIKELPPEDITIETKKNNLLISCGKIEFTITTLKTIDFPEIKKQKSVSLIKLNSQEIEEMINLTSFCVGYEDLSYALSGILFEITKNKINLVATDGKRLAFSQKTLPETQPEVKTKISFILPIKAISELYKIIKESNDDIYLFNDQNKVGFDCAETQFIARPIEGEFPDYAQYIPNASKDKVVVNRKEMLFALRRASLLTTSDYQGVKVELKKNNILFSKSTPQLGEVKESIDVEYEGPKLEIGFNPNYLVDVLKRIEDEKVSLNFLGGDKPILFKKEDYLYLLLPMKI